MSGRRGPVTALVLAAGGSRRMGRPKQLLPLAGRPLLQHALDAAAGAAVDEVILVLGHEAAAIRAAVRLPANARVIVNEDWRAGQSGSLARGLAAVGPEAVAAVVLLGDQPSVGAALVEAVVAAFRESERPVVRPVWRDAAGARHPGHPVVLARAVWPAVVGIAGDHGARPLLAVHPEWVVELPMAGPPPEDVDEPADYRRAAQTGAPSA